MRSTTLRWLATPTPEIDGDSVAPRSRPRGKKVGRMATQEMQIPKIAAGSPAYRRAFVILAVAAALTIGAVIGRETAGTSKTATAVRPASAISFVGTDSADAARRAEVYKREAAFGQSAASTWPQLTDAERRALINRLVSETG